MSIIEELAKRHNELADKRDEIIRGISLIIKAGNYDDRFDEMRIMAQEADKLGEEMDKIRLSILTC